MIKMKKITKILIGAIVFIFILSFSSMVFADTPGVCSDTDSSLYSNVNTTTGSQFWPIVQCGNAGEHCCDFTEFAIMINRIINWFISISVSVAAITFSIAGANMLLHPDNAGEREKAKSMFIKTIIGMLIVLGAWLIIHTIITSLVSSSTNALRFLNG
jgi:hypothetical protein